MPKKPNALLTLRRHKPSGRAVVRLNKQDHDLGPWPEGEDDPPDAVQTAYNALIARWLDNQCQHLATSA